MAGTIRENKTLLTADDRTGGAFSSFQSSIKKSAEHLDEMRGSLMGVAGAITGGAFIVMMKGWIEETIRANAALDDMAEKTGGSVEALSGLVNVAKVGGHDVNQLEAAMAKLAKGMVNADEETKGAGKALAFLGISATDANGNLKTSADLLPEIAKQFAKYEDGAGKAAIAQTLFGKSGAELLPYLKDLAEGTDNVVKVTAQQAAQAEALEKNIRRLAIAKGDLARTIAQEAIPVLNTVAEMYLKAKTAADGTLASTQKLAADNTLRDWFDKIAYGAAFAVDAFNGLITATQAMGQMIAGTARMAPAILDLTAALAQGNGGAAAAAWEKIKFIQAQTNEELARIIGKHKSIRFELEEQLRLARLIQQAEAGAYADQNDRRAGAKAKRPGLEWSGDGKDAATKIKSDLADIDKLLASIDNKAAGFEADFGDKMAKLWMAFQVGRISVTDYTVAQAKLIQRQPAYKKALDDEAKIQAEFNELVKEAAKYAEDYAKKQRAELDTWDKQAEALRSEIDSYGKLPSEIHATALAKEEEVLATLKLNGASEDLITHQENVIKSMRNVQDLLRKKEGIQALQEQARVWEQLADRAGNFFSDLAMNGRSAFDRLRDSLKSFAAELIALMAKKWILNLAGNFIGGSTGQMLLSAAGTAGQGTMAGMLGGAASMAGPIALAIAVNSVVGPALARAMGAGERGQKVAQTASILGGSLFGAVIGKFTDPNGLAQRTGNFGDSSLGGDTRTRGSSIFGGFGITSSKWFGDDMIEGLKKFFDGLGTFEDSVAKYLKPEEIEKIQKAFAGKTKEYGFGIEHGDFSGTLGQIFKDRLDEIIQTIDPSLQKWVDAFKGTGDELGQYVLDLLHLRDMLGDGQFAEVIKMIPDLTVEGIAKMQQAGESLSDTFIRVVNEFLSAQAALNAAIASRNPTFARELVLSQRNTIARSFADSLGQLFDEPLLQRMALNPQSFTGLNTQQMKWLADFLGLQTQLEQLDQQLAQGTQNITVSLGNFDNAINNTINELLNAQSGLADYLRGSLTGQLSPLNPLAQLAAARDNYTRNLGLAQGGDPNAIGAFGGLRDEYLRIARSIYASSGAYNDIFFSTFNQGAALTGGQVTPLTGATYTAGVQQLTASVQSVQASVQTVAGAVIALGSYLASPEGKDGDPAVRATLDAILQQLRASTTQGVLA